jgi:hypothetical protein
MIRKRTFVKAVAIACLVATTALLHAQDAVPAALAPPAGYKAVFTAKARGVQIYTSATEAGSAPKWTLEAPLAELTAHGHIIHHYAGPSWEADDGSKVVRDKDTPVTTVPSKDASKDIPWLLIKVSAIPAPGMLGKVGYVQRISTSGGVAPATPPKRDGTKVGVPYTATYVFYAKSN